MEELNSLFMDILEFNERNIKRLLIVEDNEIDSTRIANLFKDITHIEIEIAKSGDDALEKWQDQTFDVIVLDYMLHDTSAVDLVKKMNNKKQLQLTPTIIYSAKDFTPLELKDLQKIANSILLKDVSSPELLLEEAIMYLHINHKDLPEITRLKIEKIQI